MKAKLLNFFQDANVKYLFSKGIISLGFRVLGVGFSFVIVWIISNFFFEKVYGTFSLAQTIIQLLCMIFTLGVQNTLIIEINKLSESKDLSTQNFLFHVVKLVFSIALIPILLLYIFAPFISLFVFNKPQLTLMFQTIACFLPVFLLHEIAIYYFIALKRFVTFGWFMFIVPNLVFLISIFLVKDDSVTANQIVSYYGISFLITIVIEFIIIFYKSNDIIKSKFSYRKTLKESLPMMFSGLMGFLINWTDVIMLGALSTEENVGIYNAAFKVGMLVLIIIISINVVSGTKISEYYNNNDQIGLKKVIQKSTQIVTLISFPIVIFIVIFSEFILGYFGPGFLAGKMVLIIIAFSTFISALCGNVDQILNLTNSKNLLFRINVVVLVINIILNFYLIPKFGINGAAIASLVATIVLNFTCVYFVKKKLGFYTLI